MAWLRARVKVVTDPRWRVIGLKLGLSPGEVGITVLALAAEAVRAKLETGTANIKDFEWFALAAFLGRDVERLQAIVGELFRHGLIDVGGVMVTGEDWDAYVTSTERVRRKRSKDDGGATDETLHSAGDDETLHGAGHGGETLHRAAPAQAGLKRSGSAAERPSGPALPRQGPLRTRQEVAAAAGQGAPGQRPEPPAAASAVHETVATAVHDPHTTRTRVLAQPGTPGTSSVDNTEALLQALVAAAHGNVRRQPETGLFVTGITDLTIIHRLLRGGADLDRDILPSITASVAFPGQPSIPTWDLPWLIDAIRKRTQARGEPDPLPPASRKSLQTGASATPDGTAAPTSDRTGSAAFPPTTTATPIPAIRLPRRSSLT